MTGLELIIPSMISGISSAAGAVGSAASAAGATLVANPFSAISAATGLAGAGVSAAGQMAAGQAAERNAAFQAKQIELKAKEERAAAFQDAEEYKRRRDLAQSRLRAVAASSGFMADDPSTLGLAEDIEARGTLQALTAMYGGTSRAEGLRLEAAGRRAAGSAAKTGSYYGAAGTILGGIGDSMLRYSKLKGPSSPSGTSGGGWFT